MFAYLLIFICTTVTLASIVSIYVFTSRRRLRAPTTSPAVSVLKPLCGADESLEANLASFFEQSYPDFGFLFGVEDPRDAALPVVARLRARYPRVNARVVVHGRRGLNPKVANLRGMLAAGAHDLVIISDSNICVGRDYVTNMVARFHDGERVGAVTSLFSGTGEKTLGATLESLHLCGPVAGGVAASEGLTGCAVVVGKSVLFSRALFERLGGMESLASVLAEDYVMGRMFKEAGYEVKICADVIHNVTVRTSVKRFLERQARWGLLRSRVKPLLYPFEPLINPMAVALIAAVIEDATWPLLWGVGLVLLRDALQWLRLRGARGLALALPLGPVKELLTIGTWAAAPFLRTIAWRGHRLRVSAGTRLYAGR